MARATDASNILQPLVVHLVGAPEQVQKFASRRRGRYRVGIPSKILPFIFVSKLFKPSLSFVVFLPLVDGSVLDPVLYCCDREPRGREKGGRPATAKITNGVNVFLRFVVRATRSLYFFLSVSRALLYSREQLGLNAIQLT